MRDEPRVRSSVAHAETAYGAARAYVYDVRDRVWDELQADGALSRPTRLQLALALSRAHAFRMARNVAQLMVDTAGTQAIYASSPLDRLLRDAITINRHIVAQERLIELVGGLLLGEEPTLPFL
jgi:indole-3-acetate monooxygenase